MDLQRSGFAIPGIIGPIAAVIYIFAADVYEFNHTTKSIGPGSDPNSTIDDERVWKSYEEITADKFMPIMGYNEYRFRPVDDANPFKVVLSTHIFLLTYAFRNCGFWPSLILLVSSAFYH